MGLSQNINKLSLISELVLLELLDKMVKSLKFMLHSQVSKIKNGFVIRDNLLSIQKIGHIW